MSMFIDSILETIARNNYGRLPMASKLAEKALISVDEAKSEIEAFRAARADWLKALRDSDPTNKIPKPGEGFPKSDLDQPIQQPAHPEPVEQAKAELGGDVGDGSAKTNPQEPAEVSSEHLQDRKIKKPLWDRVKDFIGKAFHIHTYLNNGTIKWGFGIVAGLLAFRDFTYYDKFFSRFDPANAWISAAIGVSALLMLPVVLIELWEKRKPVPVILMSLVYAVVLACTGYITYDSVMTARKEVVSIDNKSKGSDIKGKAELTQLQKEEKEAEDRITKYQKVVDEVTPQSPAVLNVPKEDPTYKFVLAKYNQDFNRVAEAKKGLVSDNAVLSRVRPRISELLKNVDTTVEATSVGSDLDNAAVVGWAVFLDVMGPVSVYISFFL